MLTTFHLLDVAHFQLAVQRKDFQMRATRTGPLAWLVRRKFSPARFGLPEDYEACECSVDKSWPGWRPVLAGSGWSDVVEILDHRAPIENAWGREMFQLVDSGGMHERLAHRLGEFEPQSIYDRVAGNQDADELAYTLGHIAAFARWFHANYTAQRVLVMASH